MKPKILIVDDKPQNLYTLKKLLNALAVEIIETTSPFEVLDLVLEHEFCLAIVDIQMPEMDGYELVELLRSHEDFATLPIIFVSAIYSDEYHHRKGYEAGAVDFLSKPFQPDILLSKVKVFLELYRQRVKLQELIQLEKQRRHLSDTLREVAQIVSSTLNPQEVLDRILSQLENVVTYQRASVSVLVGDQLQLIGGRNAMGIPVKELLMPVNKFPLNRVTLDAKRPLLIPDVTEDNRWQAREADMPTRSFINAPLLVQGSPTGLLGVSRNDEIPYNEDDAQTVFAFASQVAIALENARLVERIRRINDELAKMNADKDKFFSIVAHDLKGPFMPLLGNAELLSLMGDSLPPQKVKEMSTDIYRSGKQLLGLLENLLQWSRLQMGRMEYQPEMVDLSELAERTVQLLNLKAQEKGIKLQHDVIDNLTVYADKYMLDTIVRNLTNNALKFTPLGGRVTIMAQSLEKYVEVGVVDTGVGISPEDMEKLLQIETHHSTAGTAEETGTGLGLIICKEMVERNGGEIWLESQLGKGTTVKFTVPIPQVAKPNATS